MSSFSGEGWSARGMLDEAASTTYGRFCLKFVVGSWRALRQGNPQTVVCFLLFLVALLSIAQQFFFQDHRVYVNQHLIPAGSMCATQDDMFDDTKRLCQMGNRYAYAYLLEHSWVMCAPNMPGARTLRRSQDSFGNFWYNPKQRQEVRAFYKTCIPTCAADDDTFHSSIGMCLLSNDIARVWLQGDGQQCDTGTPGAKAIRTASREVGDGNYWYKPEMAARVEEFYSSCTTTCAKDDSSLDRHHCSVDNPDAVAFLKGDRSVACDSYSPGRSAVSACPAGMFQGLCDGTTFWYPRRKGERVEAWYTSCMRSGAHLSSLRSRDDDADDEVDADRDADGGGEDNEVDADQGDDEGVDRDADHDADQEVDADKGDDDGGRDEVDAEPSDADADPGGGDDDTPAMTVAPDGKLQFPYPQLATSDTATVCNLSGRRYWFSASDFSQDDWDEGVGHMFIPPMAHGSQCQTIDTFICATVPGDDQRHCGYVAPCDNNGRCDRSRAAAVQGGINIINGRGKLEWLPVQGADSD